MAQSLVLQRGVQDAAASIQHGHGQLDDILPPRQGVRRTDQACLCLRQPGQRGANRDEGRRGVGPQILNC